MDLTNDAQLAAMQGLIDRLGAAVGTAVSTNLAATLTAERAVTQTDIVRAVSSIRVGGPAYGPHYTPKTETANQIMRAQSSASDWVEENPFNPDDNAVDIWKEDLKKELTTKSSRDVIEFAGYPSYIRQSNDLHLKQYEIEMKLHSLIRNFETDGLSNNQCRETDETPDVLGLGAPELTADRISVYFNGAVRKQGPHIVAHRKAIYRQMMGYQYCPVYVSLDVETLLSSVMVSGSGATREFSLNDQSPWYHTMKALTEWIFDRNIGDENSPFMNDARGAETRRQSEREGRLSNVEQVVRMLPTIMLMGERNLGATRDAAIRQFHAENKDSAMPCIFDPQHGLAQQFTFNDTLKEPMQIPIIPTDKPTLTIRHYGRLFTGPMFQLRLLTKATPMDSPGRFAVVLQDGNHTLFQHPTDVYWVNRFPIIPEYDEHDRTGRFQSGRSMTQAEFDVHDVTVGHIVKAGVNMKAHMKADLPSWATIDGVDTNLCRFTCFEYFRILNSFHREPDDIWQRTLMSYIMEEIVISPKVKITYYIDTLLRANAMLKRADLSGKGVSEETLYEKVKNSTLTLYGNVEYGKADQLSIAYFEICKHHHRRHDSTLAVWDMDWQVPKRSADYGRDWSSLDAIRAAFKRAEDFHPDVHRESYFAAYDIEARQPKSSRHVKVAALKFLDVDGKEFTSTEAADVLAEEYAYTLAEEATGRVFERTSKHVHDEIALIATTMTITKRADPSNLNTLAGGPGGPRRFADARRAGQPVVRANNAYLGIHPSLQGGDGRAKINRAADRFSQNRFGSGRNASTDTRVAEPSSRPPPKKFGDKAPFVGRDDRKPRASQATIVQQLRRKTEVMFRIEGEMKAALVNKNTDEALKKLEKVMEITQEIMIADAGEPDDGYASATSGGYASAAGSIAPSEDDDAHALHAFEELFDPTTTKDEFERKREHIMNLTDIASKPTNLSLDVMSNEFLQRHEQLLKLATDDHSIVVMTRAPREVFKVVTNSCSR